MSINLLRNVDLGIYNTMALNVCSNYFAIVNSESEILEALHFSRSENIPVCILGGGSNVIFAGNFSGMVVQVANKGITLLEETEGHVLVQVAAGEIWDEFLQYCLQQHWYGLENLAIIPGTVGAAPIQNIGAYGQEVASCIESVKVLYFSDGSEHELSNKDCQFSYRDSIFKHALHNRCIITQVTFRLGKVFVPNTSYSALASVVRDNELTAETLRNAVIHIRESRLPSPSLLPNCGSFFKNPVIQAIRCEALLKSWPMMPVYPQEDGNSKVAAGWLIEHAGWKGKRLGAFGVYEKQALVLVNYAGGDFSGLEKLVMAIQHSVLEMFEIYLEQEPVLIKTAG